MLREQEEVIEAHLVEAGLDDLEADHRALVRSLAGVQIALAFEQIQNSIWASQIDALGYLNSRPGNVASINDLKPFYEQAKKEHSELYSKYEFKQGIDFMDSWLRARTDGERIGLTVRGREFLKWRIETGHAGPFFR